MNYNDTEEMYLWADTYRDLIVKVNMSEDTEEKVKAKAEAVKLLEKIEDEYKEVAWKYIQDSFKRIGINVPELEEAERDQEQYSEQDSGEGVSDGRSDDTGTGQPGESESSNGSGEDSSYGTTLPTTESDGQTELTE